MEFEIIRLWNTRKDAEILLLFSASFRVFHRQKKALLIVFFSLSRKPAKWVCFDFDKSNEQ